MEAIGAIADFILHIDQHMRIIVEQYGVLSYAVLFFIVFLETGLVVTPFLPGDSLLFAVGALGAQGIFNPILATLLLIVAAILGDSLNYWIGAQFGEKLMAKSSLVKPEHLEKTKMFYDKWGRKAIVIARFAPIARTVAPFVAGVARMPYHEFSFYNILGAVLWVPTFIIAGYFFGSIPVVQENLTLIIIGIIVLSFVPALVEVVRKRRIESGEAD